MTFGRTRNALLLCTAVLFASAALAEARPASREADRAHADRAHAAAAPTDVSARRKPRARRHHVRNVRISRAARSAYARPHAMPFHAQPRAAMAATPQVDPHALGGIGNAPEGADLVAGPAAAAPRPGRRAAARPAPASAFGSLGGGGVVAEARRHIGTNPTGRSSLWCATFMNMVLARAGHSGTGSNLARSFASYGRRVSGPQVGAIAVMSRGRGGGHVGVVSGVDAAGNPIIISGNHNRRVAEAVYPRGRVFAYVMPN